MKSKILFISGVILFLIFVYCIFLDPFLNRLSKDEILANEVMAKASQKIEASKNLRLFGTAGQMLYEIEILGLSFQCFQKLDIDSAREMIVFAINTLMDEVNNNEEIRPYLKNYPFRAKNIEIAIYCYQSNGSDVFINELTSITSHNGIIKYYPQYADPNQWGPPILTETYEEAMARVNTK